MQSYDFEHQLVGAMMLKGDHIDAREIAGKLPAEAFENHHLRSMYRAIVSLLNKSEPVDLFTVRDIVPDDTKPLVLEVSKCISAANIRGWAKRVRQCWMLRKGAQAFRHYADLLDAAGTHNIDDIIGQVSSGLRDIQFETSEKLPQRIADLVPEYLDVLEKRLQSEASGLYLQTGIAPLDAATGGLGRSDLIIIAGRPGMGKTELAINIANGIGRRRGRGLLVSLEMSAMQVVERHIADRAGLSVGTLRTPLDMVQEQYTRLTEATGTLLEEDNYVLDGAFSVDECIAHAERLNRDGGLSFLAIDYLTLLHIPKAERHDIAIGNVTRRLKRFCTEHQVPVILLAQLNRGPESRADKRPTPGDLKDSGAIEQDADIILFPYRDEVYNAHSPLKGIAEIIIGKYRHGQTGTVYAGWHDGHFTPINQQYAAALHETGAKAIRAPDWRGK